ncbi:helix-turn-helix domain-containing protein [Pseudodesulfovibrio pelocollis]|uniref:helix-turn-helix domain-containing protein n=1 Tax=Pseudodesulfovibrio pelocollis TaxID=3051432 RepID=UPI00255B0171|nr:helix-turn-helix domain-containing protein [Pseudodesulfovibrio sp. SB368]
MLPRWLPLKTAVVYSGLSHNTLRKYADEGIIHADKTEGGHRRFDRESIDRYFNRTENETLARFKELRL